MKAVNKSKWFKWIVYGLFGLIVMLLIPAIFFPNWGAYKKLDQDLTIKLLTLIAVSIGAWRGIIEFQNNRRWKGVEFLANEYKRFIDDPYVQRAIVLLDGYMMIIPVNKNELDGAKEFIPYNQNLLIEALTPKDKEETRSPEASYIRLCIDKFLFKLGLFYGYYKSDLVRKEDLWPYLGYWMNAIGNPEDTTIEKEIKEPLSNFINEWDYKVVELIELYKLNPGFPKKTDKMALSNELKEFPTEKRLELHTTQATRQQGQHSGKI